MCKWAISEVLFASASKRVFVQNHSYEEGRKGGVSCTVHGRELKSKIHGSRELKQIFHES